MVTSKLQRRITLRKKLQILRTITNFKYVKRSSIVADALLYICNLKLKLEAIKTELANAAKQQCLPKEEVKVEKAGKGYIIKVTSKKKEDKLVSILEVFEELGINVLHAKVSTKFWFTMEAIVVAQDHIDSKFDACGSIAQAILRATAVKDDS